MIIQFENMNKAVVVFTCQHSCKISVSDKYNSEADFLRSAFEKFPAAVSGFFGCSEGEKDCIFPLVDFE